jgi:LCP family protein required for cell wall assembly
MQRTGLGVILTIIVFLVFTGSYLLANLLAGGNAEIPGFTEVNLQAGTELQGNELPPASEAILFGADFIPEGILTPWDGTSRVTVLVMGLDYRDWLAGEGPARTDTMMLLTMDPLNNTAGMLSIPRDLWVSIPGFENGRINTAYFLGEVYQTPGGGPGLAVKTVEQLMGVTINYYAQVDFGAFARFVDEIGGVKVDVPKRIRISPIGKDSILLKPGIQTLNGELALAYARARNTRGGDLDRAIRQQQVILGIRERLLTADALSRLIVNAPALYAELSAGVKTNLTLDHIIKLAFMAQGVPDENVERSSISASEVLFAESPDNQSVLVPLPEKIREIRDDIFLVSTGTLGPLTPGSSQERMVAEGSKVVLLNGSLAEGLASQTQTFLQSQGVVVVEIANGEYTEHIKIIDYTGNPHTVRYLEELLGVLPGYYELQYDPGSPVDLVVILGVDWSASNMP